VKRGLHNCHQPFDTLTHICDATGQIDPYVSTRTDHASSTERINVVSSSPAIPASTFNTRPPLQLTSMRDGFADRPVGVARVGNSTAEGSLAITVTGRKVVSIDDFGSGLLPRIACASRKSAVGQCHVDAQYRQHFPSQRSLLKGSTNSGHLTKNAAALAPS